MKPWKVAAISALVLMVLMTWPFINAYLNPAVPVQFSSIGSHDVQLERQDGQRFQLGELAAQVGASSIWFTFMDRACGQPCLNAIKSQAASRPLVVVVSPDSENDNLKSMSDWLSGVSNAVALTASEPDLRQLLASYRTVVERTETGIAYPKRWAELDSQGRFVTFHPVILPD